MVGDVAATAEALSDESAQRGVSAAGFRTASAMGAQGITVRDVGDLEALRTWLDERRGAMLVDCKVDPQIRGAWFDKVFAPGGWYQRMCGR